MKGYLEIFKGPPSSDNLIYSEHNLIVDGAGHHVANILSTPNIPRGGSDLLMTTSGIGDFGIKAMTLGTSYQASAYKKYPDALISSKNLVALNPNPTDTSLQPLGVSGLGHFVNYYNFSAHYGSLNTNEIEDYGSYLPSGGITFEGSSFGYTHPGNLTNDMSGTQIGVLNAASAINSDGFILESTLARSSQTLYDASAGFIVSSIGDLSSTREVKYILTLTYADWKFLDYYYGGIVAIGLWTLDREATLLKYGDEFPNTNIDLYNIVDISKNPVFKLFSKKIFLPGGLKIDQSSGTYKDYLTISWSIKF